MICVLCQNEIEDAILTSDGHVCLVHVYNPDEIHLPPFHIYRMQADGTMLDVTNGDPNPYNGPPPEPAPTINLKLTLAEASALKDAVSLAASMLPRRTVTLDKTGRTANYWAGGLDYMALIRKINMLMMEEVGIVKL